METRSGKVVNTYSEVKNPPGKRPFSVHAIELDGGDVIEVGYKQPYRIGQTVTLNVEFKYGKWAEVKGGAVGSPSPVPTPSVGPSGGSAAAAPMNFPIPKTNKETAIIRQNALTNAVQSVGALLVNGNLSGMTTDKFAEEVLNMAYKYAEFSSGQREVRLAADMTSGKD